MKEQEIFSLLDYLQRPSYLRRHMRRISFLRKQTGLVILSIAMPVMLGGFLLIALNFEDFWVSERAILCSILGMMISVGGLVLFFWGLGRLIEHSRVEMPSSIKNACIQFYKNAFCKRSTNTESKKDQILSICHLFPIPILARYVVTTGLLAEGWVAYGGIPATKKRASIPLECALCHKKIENSRPLENYGSKIIPLQTKKDMYLKCEYCNNFFCYKCICYSEPKERYLCPFCGKSTNGWDGLVQRWELFRKEVSHRDIEFELSEVSVEETPTYDPRVIHINVHLSGSPFGQVIFSNVAFKIAGKCFLGSPEPIVVSRHELDK